MFPLNRNFLSEYIYVSIEQKLLDQGARCPSIEQKLLDQGANIQTIVNSKIYRIFPKPATELQALEAKTGNFVAGSRNGNFAAGLDFLEPAILLPVICSETGNSIAGMDRFKIPTEFCIDC